METNAPTIASIPAGTSQAGAQSELPIEKNFPIELPEGLTAEDVKNRTKEFRKIWKPWADRTSRDLKAYYAMFMGEPTNLVKSKTQATLNVSAGIVETLVSRLCKVIWGKDKLIDVMPLDPGVDEQTTQIVEDFINQEVIYVSRGTRKGKSIIKSAVIDGVGMWREKWNVKKETRSQPIYESPQAGIAPIFTGATSEDIEYQCWDWEEMNPLMICFNPDTKDSISNSPWNGIRTNMSLAELKKWESEGKIQNVDQIATITPSQITNKDDWEAKLKNALGNNLNKFEYANHREYTVDEWFGTLIWDVDQEGLDAEGNPLPKKIMSDDFHWIVVEESIVVLFKKNELEPKRKPTGSFPFILDPRKPFGKSGLHDVKNTQELLNNFGGKQADLVELAANRPVYYDKTSGMSGRTAFQRTQGLISVGNVNGIKEGQVDTSAITVNQGFINFLIDFARSITAANEQAQGIQGKDITATEFAGLSQMIGARFEDLADNIIQFFIVPLAQGCLDYYQQYGIDGQMVLRELSIDGSSQLVTRDMLKGRWQIVPCGSNAQADKEARITAGIEIMKMLMNLAQAAKVNPALTGGQMPNIKVFFDEYLSTYLDFRQPQNLWGPLPPPMLPPGMGGPSMGPGTPPSGPMMPSNAMPPGMQ